MEIENKEKLINQISTIAQMHMSMVESKKILGELIGNPTIREIRVKELSKENISTLMKFVDGEYKNTFFVMNEKTLLRVVKVMPHDVKKVKGASPGKKTWKLFSYKILLDNNMPDIAIDTCPIILFNQEKVADVKYDQDKQKEYMSKVVDAIEHNEQYIAPPEYMTVEIKDVDAIIRIKME